MSRSRPVAFVVLVSTVLAFVPLAPAAATTAPEALPFAQSWTDTGQITANDDWSGVPGVIGYRGDDLTAATGTDPQTIAADGSGTPVDVNANLANPNTFATGGVSEFELSDPVVALQGSGTADAPHLVITFNTAGLGNITVAYTLRDIDGSADNAVQPVALQYRIGSSGSYTNVAAAFVADATTGPSQATLVTPVSAQIPANANNKPVVQVRIITTNAVGNDEWVGVDDLAITGSSLPHETAPSVESTSPASGAIGVAVNANITITFSEPVTASGAWFTIVCAATGSHPAVASGGSTTFTLDPDSDFADSESCTVTVLAASVSDQDTDDPPDNPVADHAFSFTTVAPTRRIHAIQGTSHISPFAGTPVRVRGIVTQRVTNGFFIQDEEPDADPKTSEGLFVFTSAPPGVSVGDRITVDGSVAEFRAGGGASANLTITEITSPSIAVASSGNALPAATLWTPPAETIEDDATGDVETSGVFDPATDGIDYAESLEGMRVQINDATATGPSISFPSSQTTEVSLVGAGAGVRTARGGIVIRATDFNPERLILQAVLGTIPTVNVGDTIPGATVGVLDYNFGNYKLRPAGPPTFVSGGLARETTTPAAATDLAVATFNVENLDANDPQAKFDELAGLIVHNLRAPDLIALEEVQDNNGPVNDAVVDASGTLSRLIVAIEAAGGPEYVYRQIDPVDDRDGGEPGGNIRQAFFFRTDRGLAFVDRPGGGSNTDTTVVDTATGPQLSASPGRIRPNEDGPSQAFNASRKPLAGEFLFNARHLFVVANHFNSKGGDQPLFGRFQPPTRVSEVQRVKQAQIVRDFVAGILDLDPQADVIVLGDINDFEFSDTMTILKSAPLTALIETLPPNERYTFVFDGNAQALDHILVSASLRGSSVLDVVHVNSEYADQASDHEPQVARVESRVTEARLCALVERLVTKEGIRHSLCSKLENAVAARERGNLKAADSVLKAFRNEIEAQRGKSIAAEDADRLIELSARL
ncbi:MAG TPA: Ig-like domain-containing protein [Candidatus Limnocylindria bacterium]|jgi:hypothetical protein|nr:Ig-like domain-containing protein [Candidatus Limnocylindria bacterium]